MFLCLYGAYLVLLRIFFLTCLRSFCSPATSQHIDTPDNTVETKFDFNEENYKRVEMVSYT